MAAVIHIVVFFFFCLFVFLPFLGPLAQHMEVPRPGVQPELYQRPTPQPMATPDPQPAEQGQGSNPQPYGSQSDSSTTEPRRELLYNFK